MLGFEGYAMARIPKQKRSVETRRKIIATGRRLFSTEGYHATSSKKIAREAGIAVGSFYNHFDDKKELLLEVYRQHVVEVHDMVARELGRSVLATADGQALVGGIIEQTLKMHDLSPDLHREIAALSYTDETFKSVVQQEEERVVAVMRQLLEPHRDALRVTDLDAAARVTVLAVESVVHDIKMFGSSVDEARLTGALSEMVYRYLFV